MARFNHGLVVGKFSPLHRGHEHLIRRALDECGAVTVISYSLPEYPGHEAARRESWIRALFPQVRRLVLDPARLATLPVATSPALTMPANDAPDDEHRDFVALLCRELLGVDVDAVFTSERYGDGFAARLTWRLRGEMPVRPIQHVMVDEARSEVPISATAIRADVHAHRRWLSPAVYASFVRRVCLLGGESSGKTVLAESLASALGTSHVAEFGRELWERKRGQLVYDDMLMIAERQVSDEEDAAGRANRILICDTSPLTTLFYSQVLFDRADPALEALANRVYDACVLCAPDFPFVQDGTRADAAFRERGHQWYVDQLSRRGIRYLVAEGPLHARVERLAAVLRYPA